MATKAVKAPTLNGKANGKAVAPPDVEEPAQLDLLRLDLRTLMVRIVGDSPLICNRWSEKAKQEMSDRVEGKASPGRTPRVPQKVFLASLYRMSEGRYGFPAGAFKSAAVDACTSLGKKVTKVAVRQAFHIEDELVEIKGTPTPRKDMVRNANGNPDVRHRGEFKKWSCILHIRYNHRALTAEQIINLINTGGFGVGVGDWRPEKNGSYGRFHVAGRDE